jgi:Carboxypeptidase regulatory-like domain
MRLRHLISPFVLLLGFCAAGAQPKAPAQDPPIIITGRVQSQGKPLAGALITLWDQQSGGDPSERSTVATGRTDAEGNYELKDVPTGNYLIAVSAPGYVTGKENDMLAKLRYVTVVGGQSVGPFNFDLVREGVIAGVVTDAAGKPLTGIPITLITDLIPDGGPPKYAENIRTDDRGHYRIAGMPAGKYRLAAGHWPLARGTARGQLAYRRIFYPNSVDEAQARTIDLSAGSELTGIDFNLGQPATSVTVHARFVDDRTGKPVEGLEYFLSAYLKGKLIGVTSLRDSRSDNRGEIVLQNIPPGEYVISTPAAKGIFRKDDPQIQYSGESRHFEVVDKDVGDIEVRVTRGASVAGFVVVEGPASAEVLAKVPEMSLFGLVETNPITPAPFMRTTIRPDGSFLLTGLRAGKLKLNFAPPPPGTPLPLSFVRIEREGVKFERELEIQPGEEITGLRLVMAYAASGIHGVVKLDDGSVPQGLIGLASVWQGNVNAGNRSVVNQNGEFILQNLVAGEYKLLVVAHDAIGRSWHVEQTIKIDDDKVTEAKMVFNSKVKPNPSATSKSYLQP